MSTHPQGQARWEETQEASTRRRSLAATDETGWVGTIVGILLALSALALVLMH